MGIQVKLDEVRDNLDEVANVEMEINDNVQEY